MSYQENDMGDVDFRDLVFNILYRWRIIIIVATVFAFVLGGMKTAKGILDLRNSSDIEQLKINYQSELEIYEANKQTYENEIENITNNMHSFNEYMLKSVLMQIDPYNKPVATAEIYIKTDFKIMPGMVYQNNDYTDSIIKMYALAIAQKGLSDDLEDIMPDVDKGYISELLAVRPDYDSDMIQIFVTHTDIEVAQKSLNNILQNIESYSDNVTSKIGSHEIEILNNVTYYVVEPSLAKNQEENRNNQTAMQEKLDAISDKLTSLEEPVYNGLTKTGILKGGIRYAILGGLLGAFASCGFILLSMLVHDKILSAKEIRYNYNIPILCTVKRDRSKFMGKVDAWIDRVNQGGIELETDRLYKICAANINNYAQDSKHLVLIGAAGKEILQESLIHINEALENKTILFGGNVLTDIEALKVIPESDGIILVEKRGVSKRSDILNVLDIAEVTGKKIVGCILF